ncbi:MAG: SpaA isopeptide-forming pilin-related protein, partial [Chloroflexota bacterium]|nr:SpaA isopeptide-forming pilin-related protein [Chloroflexota bacterium]
MRRGMREGMAAATRRARRLVSLRHGHRLSPSALFVHLFVALTLGAGLLMPLTDVGQALANPGFEPQPIRISAQNAVPGAASQVIAFGNFQSQLGCGDDDPACQSTSLGDSGGIWTANFPIAPGSYSVQFAVVAQNGNQFTYGQGGQDGGSIDFQVGDGQAGAFLLWNSHTNEVQAEGIDALYTVQTDVGSFVPTPSDGNLDVVIPSQGGTVSVQLLANGTPVADPQQASLSGGWTRVTLDTAGNVLDSEGLTYGTLTVVRLDADGNPAGGACYQLESGGLANQACDSDDGSLDGNTLMSFPEGLDPGGYRLVEAQSPDGLDRVDDQEVDLQPGDNAVQVQQPGGDVDGDEGDDGSGEEDGQNDGGEDGNEGDPTEDIQTRDLPIGEDGNDEGDQVDQGPGDLIVALLDDDSNPIGGACWELIQDGNVVADTCDATDNFPFNGVVGFFGVPGGEYTLRQSETPEGSEPLDDRTIEITAGQELREEITASVGATEQPEDETGDVVVTRQDGDGNLVGGSCFEIVDGNGDEIADDVCDEDGDVADDGRTGFFNVPVGTWLIQETRTPDGFDEASPVQVTVNAGQASEAVAQGAAIQQQQPTEVPTDDSTEEPTDGIIDDLFNDPTEEPADDPTEEPSSESTEVPAPGNVVVNLTDDEGNPVGGACFELIQVGNVLTESCDANDQFPNNGRTGFFGIPSGDYTLRQSTDLEGFQTLDDQDIEIAPNDDRTLDITVASTSEPTEEPRPTEEPQPTDVPDDSIIDEPDVTEEPEPTAEPVETETAEPTQADLGPPGSLIVTLQDAGGQNIGGACFELLNGDDVIDSSCDVDDDFPDNGRTGFFGVTSGTFTLEQSIAQPGTEPIAPVEVEVVPGQTTEFTVSAPDSAGEPTAELEPSETPAEPTAEAPDEPANQTEVRFDVSSLGDSDGPICLELNTTGGIGLADPPAACDNGAGDVDDEQGVILLDDVPPGQYGLFVTEGPPEAVDQEWPAVTVEEGGI